MEKQELLNQIFHEILFLDVELEDYKIIFKDIFGVRNYISGTTIQTILFK